jgi:hypothetical protein
MTAKGGPKTVQGKEISAKNSLKHGLTAKGLISTDEETALSSLTGELINEYDPKGPIEKLLVKDLAMIRVQLERFKDVEAALFLNSQQNAISAQALVGSLKITNENIIEELIEAINTQSQFTDKEHEQETEWISKVEELVKAEEPLTQQCKTLIKTELRADCIDNSLRPLELIEELEKNNSNPEEPIRIIRLIGVTHEDVQLEKAERDQQLAGLQDYQLLDYLKAKKIENYQNHKKQKLLETALTQKDAMINAALPAPGELDRIYRYRTTLEKQFSNKLSQLIQLQELRERKARIAIRS